MDGLRLDAVHAFEDRSAIPFLEELGEAVRALGAELGRPLVLIAESDLNDPRLIRDVAAHGCGMDAQWSDDFHHALHVALTGERQGYYADFTHEPVELLARTLREGWVYTGQRSVHRARRHGRRLGDLPLSRLLGYAQNHDQVGNRPRGERLSQLVGVAQQKLALHLVLTAPFVPLLFMGEEWGASTPFQFFTSHEDEAVAEATRRGRRAEHHAAGVPPEEVPDPQDEATFLRSRLRHDERRRAPHDEIYAYAHALVALRRSTADLRRADPSANRVAVVRTAIGLHRGRHVSWANLGAEPVRVEAAPGAVVVLSSSGGVAIEAGTLLLPGYGAAVLRA
jgi:maltooligosyltrehalose trehalohydrolase